MRSLPFTNIGCGSPQVYHRSVYATRTSPTPSVNVRLHLTSGAWLHKVSAGSSNLAYDCPTQPAQNPTGKQDFNTPKGPLQLPELHVKASEFVPDRAVQAPQLKIIGLGMRGVSSANKLAASGQVREADFWAIDSDRKSLASCEGSMQTMEVIACDDASMRAEDLARIAQAPASVPPERKDGGAGMAFVMGSSSGSPGGGTLMLQLVNHLRRQGFFVAVALTRPFGFEGNRKMEQADALVEAMEEVSNLVVVVDQDVLTKASAELTIAEASAIAENTLQYSVRSMLWALQAPEILNASNGSFLWHGRDLRAMRRLLFPPMMSFLTCPGHGNLGRGQAAIPSASLQQAGLPSMLSTLAEDAVRAACESPFLDDKMGVATAVLCVLRFPAATQGTDAMQAGAEPSSLDTAAQHPGNSYEYALRSAVQVAAMTVQELAGPACRDIVVCPQLEEETESDGSAGEAGSQGDGAAGQGGVITMECSLLVLKAIEDSAGLEFEPEEPSLQSRQPLLSSRSATAAAARLHVSATPNQTPTVASVTGGVQRGPPSPASQKQGATAAAAVGEGATTQRTRGPLGMPLHTTPPRSTPQQPQPQPSLGEDTVSTASSSPPPSPSRLPSSSSAATAAASRTQGTSAGPSSTGQANTATPGPVPSSAGRQPPQRGSSKWSAMSMLAGGTTDAALGAAADVARSARRTQYQQQQQQQQQQQRPTGGRYTQPPPSPSRQQLQLQQQQYLQQQVERRRQQIRQGLQPSPLEPLPTQPHQQQQQQSASSLHSQKVLQVQQQQQQQQRDAWGRGRGAQAPAEATRRVVQPTQIPRMADNLMTSLVAQSLDLPPSAARWRHHQRAMDSSLPGSLQQQQQQRRIYDLPVSSSVLVDDEELEEWSDDSSEEDERGISEGVSPPPNPLAAMLMGMAGNRRGGGRGAGQGAAETDLKSRVAGMLDKERA